MSNEKQNKTKKHTHSNKMQTKTHIFERKNLMRNYLTKKNDTFKKGTHKHKNESHQ